MNKNRYFFTSAYTGKGYLSYWPNLFKELKRLYLLQGNTPSRQSLVVRSLGLAMTDRGCSVHYYHRAEDHLMFEGLTVPSQGFGVLSGSHPCTRQDFFPVHLETVTVELPGSIIPSVGYEKVLKLIQSAGEIYLTICCSFSPAADKYAAGAGCWVEEFQERPSYLQHYFAGSASGGLVFPGDILDCCRKRYVIKGPLGAGSVVMHDILVQALSRRYVVEVYHSILEPSHLVVLFFPEIGVAVFDETCCYNEFSLSSGDIVWNLGKGTQAARFSGDNKEIKYIIAQAGRELEQFQKELENGGPYLTAEEIDGIISQIIKDAAR